MLTTELPLATMEKSRPNVKSTNPFPAVPPTAPPNPGTRKHLNSLIVMISSSLMKTAAPSLTPLLRSDAQGDVLALLLLNPDQEFSLAEITRHTGAQVATVHREVERLVTSRVLKDRRVGRARLVSVRTDHEWFAPLSEILRSSYGVRVVLERLLTDVPGVQEAYIYGSWAARYRGEPGPPPRDIDVLIVGESPQTVLSGFGRTAQRELRREVNVNRVTPEDWSAEASPFVKTVRQRPLVPLVTEKDGRR